MQGLLSPLSLWKTNRIRGSLRALIQRYIATLKASDGGYISLPQPIEIGAGDDFELEVVLQTDRDDANYSTLLHSTDQQETLRLQKNKYVDGGQTWEHGSYQFKMITDVGLKYLNVTNDKKYPDYITKFNNLRLVRQGKVASFYVGNELQSTVDIGAESWLPFTLARINENGTCRFLEFKVTKNGQKIIDYDLNAKHGTTIIPNLTQPLGSELWVNPTVHTSWTDNGDGSWTKNHTSWGALGFGVPLMVVKPNTTYQLTYTASGVTSPACGLYSSRDGAGNNARTLIYNGTHTILIKIEATGGLWFDGNDAVGLTISNVSLKEAPHWAEYINVTDDNKELYTWNAEHNAWVGGENLYKATPILDGSAQQYYTMQTSPSTSTLEVNTKYLVKVDAINLVGEFSLRIGNASLGPLTLRTGDTSTGWFVADSLDHDRFYLQERSPNGTTADSITVQVYKILEVA